LNLLATRIDIHSKFGSRDIDRWTLDLVRLQPDSAILDVGCGAGKQCFSYFTELKGAAKIVGGDVSPDLLVQAREETGKQKAAIQFIPLNFNERFPLEDDTFDFVSCCFAIYYAENVPFTISEMHRVLKPGGRLFTTGPMPENKKLFYDVVREATQNKPIPPMPGSSRYGSEFLSTIRSQFAKVDVHIFENPLTFTSAEPFLAYTRASLSEDRKLWNTFFKDKSEFEAIMDQIKKVVHRRIEAEGKLVMTKVVGGFLATK
jgi:ubiquinone/menaquinone biosynthesis C-methylase UbiE